MSKLTKTFTIIDPAQVLPGWGWYVAKHVDELFRAGLIPPDETHETIVYDSGSPSDALSGAINKAIGSRRDK